MAYFKVCPDCGAHLDPGERCDCQGKKPLPYPAKKNKYINRPDRRRKK